MPEILRPQRLEGAGNAGCPMHPQPGARWGSEVCAPVFTAEAPESSGIPHAMVFTVSGVLPGDEFLFATVAARIEWRYLIPVGPNAPPRGLASATDARTTRLRRTHQCRSSCTPLSIAHEFAPALRPHAHTTLSRPPHPASRFVTIGRNAPLHRGGMAQSMVVICPTAQAPTPAALWHDGQFRHGWHARVARRAEVNWQGRGGLEPKA